MNNYYIENGSLGFHTFGRIVRRRKALLALGIILGLVAGIAYALLATKTYTASALVHLTAVSADGMGRTGNSDNRVDMVTERQLAASAATADAAVEELGGDFSRDEILDGVEITGGPDGSVLRVNFSADSEARAQEGAMGIATAFLSQRTEEAANRNAAIEENIDDQISAQQEELQAVQQDNRRSNNSTAQAQEEAIRQTISALQQRKIELGEVFGTAGSIITPADANPVYANPSLVKSLALGLGGGLALGLILALGAHVLSRRPGDAEDVELITGAPVWRAVPGEADESRWDLAAGHTRRAQNVHGSVTVMVDRSDSAANSAAKRIAAASKADTVSLNEHFAASIAQAGQSGACVAVIPQTWEKKRMADLAEDLRLSGANLIGVVLVPGAKA